MQQGLRVDPWAGTGTGRTRAPSRCQAEGRRICGTRKGAAAGPSGASQQVPTAPCKTSKIEQTRRRILAILCYTALFCLLINLVELATEMQRGVACINKPSSSRFRLEHLMIVLSPRKCSLGTATTSTVLVLLKRRTTSQMFRLGVSLYAEHEQTKIFAISATGWECSRINPRVLLLFLITLSHVNECPYLTSEIRLGCREHFLNNFGKPWHRH